MTPFVRFRIDRQRLGAPRMPGDIDLDAACIEIGDDSIAVKGLVGDQRVEAVAVDQRRHADGIEAVAWHENGPDCRANRSARESSWSCFPWSVRALSSESPFCALGMLADLDNDCIVHGELHIGLIRAGLEKPNETSALIQSRYRLKPVFQLPKKAGRSRQGLPVP